GDGNNFLDTMHIRDFISGIIKVIESNVKNKIIDFCKSNPVTLKELSITIGKVFNRNNFNLICGNEVILIYQNNLESGKFCRWH
ncbi:MAG: hypothetical protein CL722_04810, partial [Chloroflexi bacterium]|nr:hypothetical protein [Chloroflexota bacterium]